MADDGRSMYPCHGGLAEFGKLVDRAAAIRLTTRARASGATMVSLVLVDSRQNPGYEPFLCDGASWDLGWSSRR